MGYRRVMRSGSGCSVPVIALMLLAVGLILGTAFGGAMQLIGSSPLLVIGGATYIGLLIHIARRRS